MTNLEINYDELGICIKMNNKFLEIIDNGSDFEKEISVANNFQEIGQGSYEFKDLDITKINVKMTDKNESCGGYWYTEVIVYNEEEELLKIKFDKWYFNMESNLPFIMENGKYSMRFYEDPIE